MCKISVVVPVYKVEEYITHTMQSLLNQTYRDFEIVLVDDGSPDNSTAVAQALLEKGDIPYQILRQENSGQGVARNYGVAVSKGDWIYFLDSDDVIQPDALETVLNIAEETEGTDIVYTAFQYVYENMFKAGAGEYRTETFDRAQMLDGFLVRKKVVLVPGTLYRKAFLVDNEIHHTGIRWSEDQLFMWNVLSHVNKAVYTHRVLYNYYRHPNSIMSATPAFKIVDAYTVWKETMPQMGNENTKKFALSRWVLGCVREYARRSAWHEWKELAKSLDTADHMRVLRAFPDKKVRLVAMFGGNLKLLYWILRKI